MLGRSSHRRQRCAANPAITFDSSPVAHNASMGRRRRDSDAALVVAVFAIAAALIVGIFKLIAAIARGFSTDATQGQRHHAKALLGGTVAVAMVLAIAAISASHDSGTSDATASGSSPPSPPPPSRADLGARALAEASACIETARWDCVDSALRTADDDGAATTAERERAAAAALREAQASYDAAKKARKKERLQLLQRAAASATFAHDIAPQGESAAAAKRLAATALSKITGGPVKVVAKKAPTASPAPVDPYVEPAAEQPVLQLVSSDARK